MRSLLTLVFFVVFSPFLLSAQSVEPIDTISNQTKLVLAKLLLTHKAPRGHTLTLPTHMGLMLTDAISRFGPRDESFTLLGVEIDADEAIPYVWYAGNPKHVVIRLGSGAASNAEQALFQLAHEVVHCLSPVGILEASVLEEGLATYFSEDYLHNRLHRYWRSSDARYATAGKLARRLLAIDGDIIRRIRGRQPVLSKITPQQLIEANQNVPLELAEALCKPF